MIYEIDFSEKFENDIPKFKSYPVLTKKIGKLILEIKEHPTTGTGKPEPLKGYGERSIYSRRIDQKHRLIYEILEIEKVVKILSAYGHYDDK